MFQVTNPLTRDMVEVTIMDTVEVTITMEASIMGRAEVTIVHLKEVTASDNMVATITDTVTISTMDMAENSTKSAMVTLGRINKIGIELLDLIINKQDLIHLIEKNNLDVLINVKDVLMKNYNKYLLTDSNL